MRITLFAAFYLTGLMLAPGCGKVSEKGHVTDTAIKSQYLLAEEPNEVIGVIEARESARDGDSIAVVARIGGAIDPWITGRAAFMLFDASMSLVPEGTEFGEGEVCTGDCCAAERTEATMLAKIVDEKGRVLEIDARQLLGLQEDDMVVVRGKAAKDKSGNVILVADGVYLRR